MIFQSLTAIPGAQMNRYGMVFVPAQTAGILRAASPDERGAVMREAIAAGCTRVPPDNEQEFRDSGYIWQGPTVTTQNPNPS